MTKPRDAEEGLAYLPALASVWVVAGAVFAEPQAEDVVETRDRRNPNEKQQSPGAALSPEFQPSTNSLP